MFLPSSRQSGQAVRNREHVVAVGKQTGDVLPHVGVIIRPENSGTAIAAGGGCLTGKRCDIHQPRR